MLEKKIIKNVPINTERKQFNKLFERFNILTVLMWLLLSSDS